MTLDPDAPALAADTDLLLGVHESLERLAGMDPQLAQIVELRFFGGMGHQEIATALDTSLRSVERGWRLARAWLHDELKAGEGDRRGDGDGS